MMDKLPIPIPFFIVDFLSYSKRGVSVNMLTSADFHGEATKNNFEKKMPVPN